MENDKRRREAETQALFSLQEREKQEDAKRQQQALNLEGASKATELKLQQQLEGKRQAAENAAKSAAANLASKAAQAAAAVMV